MKKFIALLVSFVLVFSLAACGSSADSGTSSEGQSQGTSAGDGAESQSVSGEAAGETVTLRVGASPTPHAEILAFAKDILLSDYNVDLEIVEYSDYVVPNTAVEEGEDDANYFQHTAYLETFNEENGTHLVSVAKIHYEPFGLYSNTVTDLADLPDGAVIAIPNDGSNEARALYLLEAEGLITLDHEVGFNATVLDITDNPKNITFQEVAAEMVARTIDDVDGAIVNGNYALEAGLDIEDAIATESADSESAQTYANVIVVEEGNEENEAVKALVEVLTSEAVYQYITDTYNGAVVPVFSVSGDETEETAAAEIDKEAFDDLLASGSTADDAEIASSEWAAAVKEAGVLKIGGTRTSFLFSQLDETDGQLRGFDAGLYRLLAKYILGDENSFELTQVDSSTRESVLQSGQVDAVFATYSITPSRQEVISFAGPYYTSRQAILVKAGNTEITGLDDLAGKTVATQAGSTGPDILAEYSPDAVVQEFQDDISARTALEQGRVDAYVTDYTLLLNAIVKNPGVYEIAGDTFGPEDNYGIGLPLDSDGVEFVNNFLTKLIDDGTWEQLWQISLGDRTGIKNAPDAPVIE